MHIESPLPLPRVILGSKSGRGKGTISKMLYAELLPLFPGLILHSAGNTMRRLAEIEETTVEDPEFQKRMRDNPVYDKMVDGEIEKLVTEGRNFIMESHLGNAFDLSHRCLAVLITCDDSMCYERIFERDRERLNLRDVAHAQEITQKRDMDNAMRYLDRYGFDQYLKPQKYDLVVNNSENPQICVQRIMRELAIWQTNSHTAF